MKAPEIISGCKFPSKSGRGYKWPILTELHLQLFEEEFTDSHNAGADVEACAWCYFELRKWGNIAQGGRIPLMHRILGQNVDWKIHLKRDLGTRPSSGKKRARCIEPALRIPEDRGSDAFLECVPVQGLR